MKNLLIIGGSAGIGAAVVNILLSENHKVYSSYKTKPLGISHEHLVEFEFDVEANVLDLSVLPEQIHGLVYCPGLVNLKPFGRTKPEEFVNDYQIQVLGFIKVLQKVLPKLQGENTASVVTFSSVAVQKGFPYHTLVSSSKGAIEGLTKALSAEYAPKIRFNTIAPSLTMTGLVEKLVNTPDKIEANASKHPLKRLGTPEDIAHMVAFLLDDKSSWMTGQIIGIDGGASTIKV